MQSNDFNESVRTVDCSNDHDGGMAQVPATDRQTPPPTRKAK
jgi:hypothetical protein